MRIKQRNTDTKQMQAALEQCIAKCIEAETAMMRLSDRKDYEKSIRHCIDCYELCSLALSLLKRKSPYIINILHLCEQMCLECSVECDMHSDHIEECGQCADACRLCSEACDTISKDVITLL